MKNVITMFAVIAVLAACEKKLPSTGTFGDKSVTEAGATPIADFIAAYDGASAKEGKVIGTVTKVCQSKGCWFNLDLGGDKFVRIITKNHDFSIPKDASGKTAIAQGTLKTITTDVERLKHLAEDDGKSKEEIEKITAPKVEYEFEATGIIIK